jgi:hypothetical protein
MRGGLDVTVERYMRISSALAFATALFASNALGCCAIQDKPKRPLTIDGPEDPALRNELRGTVVLNEPNNREALVDVVTLPGGERRTLKVPPYRVQCVSGPDTQGRIAYVQQENYTDEMFDKGVKPRYWLRLASLNDKPERVLLEARGYHPYSAVALASSADVLAVSVAKDSDEEFPPPMSLDIWDLKSGKATRVEDVSSCVSAAWLDDGNRLVFVSYMNPEACPEHVMRPREGGPFLGGRGLLSVVRVRDVKAGTTKFLQAGNDPVPSADGASIYVMWGREILRIDSTTGAVLARRIQLPGRYRSEENIIADLGGGLVLYEALPTAGSKSELIPGSKSMKWTLKVADLERGTFCTVVPDVHHNDITYAARTFAVPPSPK